MKQTRQAVRTIKQSIYLDVYGYTFTPAALRKTYFWSKKLELNTNKMTLLLLKLKSPFLNPRYDKKLLSINRVTRRLGENHPNIGKSNPNSCQVKNCQNIYPEAQFESRKHFFKTLLNP
jgi:hypothetical protein